MDFKIIKKNFFISPTFIFFYNNYNKIKRSILTYINFFFPLFFPPFFFFTKHYKRCVIAKTIINVNVDLVVNVNVNDALDAVEIVAIVAKNAIDAITIRTIPINLV